MQRERKAVAGEKHAGKTVPGSENYLLFLAAKKETVFTGFPPSVLVCVCVWKVFQFFAFTGGWAGVVRHGKQWKIK